MTSSPQLSPLLQGFFAEHLLVHKCVSPQTVASYRDAFRLLLGFIQIRTGIAPCDLDLTQLDAPTILSFLDDLEQVRRNSVRSRNLRLTAIRSFFRYASLREPGSLGQIAQVLAIPVKRAPRRLVAYLTRTEMEALLSAPDRSRWSGNRDHGLLLMLYNTGARVSEIATLRRSQITFGTSSFVQLYGKGRKERTVPLWSKTVRTLRAWFCELGSGRDISVFPNARGGALSRHGVAFLIRRAAKAACARCPSLASKQVSPHVLRHTTAMHLLQSGVDQTVIALWLGHESVETTHMYVEADLAMKERALEKLDPPNGTVRRFSPSDPLVAFLENL